jgi:ribosomal protein S4
MTKRIKTRNKLYLYFQEDIWGKLHNYCIKNRKNYKKKKTKFFYKKINLFSNRYFFLKKRRRVMRDRYDIFRIDISTPPKRKAHRNIRRHPLVMIRKLRKYYGDITEKHFSRIAKKARLMNIYMANSFSLFLECRLDTLLFRLNLVASFYEARQIINHKNIYINGKLISFSNYIIRKTEILSIYKTLRISLLKKILFNLKNDFILINYPSKYLEVNYKSLSCMVLYDCFNPKNIPFFARKMHPKFVFNYYT